MAERQHREVMWKELLAAGGPSGVGPEVLRGLGIYGGAQGIWVDKARTAPISPDGNGVTVSVLHTGSSYPDDLSEDALLYHYPLTDRPASRDAGEVQATKNAQLLDVPIFVVTKPSPSSGVRDVQLGWVVEWDDEARLFLIELGHEPAAADTRLPAEVGDSEPFFLTATAEEKRRLAKVRPGQPRFKMGVLRRYGTMCAVCSVSEATLLDAAHLCSKSAAGSDDPRNGLLLCALHHHALDAGFWAIDPESGRVVTRVSGPDAAALRLERTSIAHLAKPPHRAALDWLWERWSA